MMIEAEARKKWCPKSRICSGEYVAEKLFLNSRAVNRVNVGDNLILPTGANCIASDCMLWWWNPCQITGEYKDHQNKREGCCGLSK